MGNRLHGFTDYGETGLSDALEQSFYCFLQWGFVCAGAWENVERATSGVYGGDFSRLRCAADPNYTDGQVWEGVRRDWVWETGVDYSTQPIRVSGVWVDGVFWDVATTGSYAHLIDYPNGRIVFDEAISPSSVVQASHSYRRVHFATADSPWFRELQANSLRADDPHFLLRNSGEWDVPAAQRMQLPAIVVEATPDINVRGLALGGGKVVTQGVLFHVLAETAWERKRLHDILTEQCFERVSLINVDRAMAETGYPLDAEGSPIPFTKQYPEFTQLPAYGGYSQGLIRIEKVQSIGLPDEVFPGLHAGVVRFVCEVDMV